MSRILLQVCQTFGDLYIFSLILFPVIYYHYFSRTSILLKKNIGSDFAKVPPLIVSNFAK